MLGRDAFTSGKRFKDVECKSLGGWTRLQSLSVSEFVEFEDKAKEFHEAGDDVGLMGLFLTFCLVDENNERILTPDDIQAVLETVGAGELTDIFQAAQDLNGLSDTEDDLEKK